MKNKDIIKTNLCCLSENKPQNTILIVNKFSTLLP